MRRLEVRIVGGILLIAAGVLFLLQNFDILGGGLNLLWALLFGAGGAIFLYVFLVNRANWWAVIPGFVLLSLAALMTLNQLFPQAGELWGGSLFLGGLGLAFWVVYLANRENWWAAVPGGVLLTLAVVTGLSSTLEGIETGGVFLLGLGLTFGLLSFLPTPDGRMRWAIIPAAVLLAMGLLLIATSASLFQYLWPAALILAGLYLIVRILGTRQSQ